MKIPIVDEQDNIIEYKDREDRNPNDIIRITAIWINDESGNILLQQRKLSKKVNPGKWGPAVSGTVEEGETYELNAYKEMEEEIGVTGIKLVESKKIYGITNTGKRFAQLYIGQIDSNHKLIPQLNEVEELKWFSKEELVDFYNKSPEFFVRLMKDLIELFLE